MTTAAVAHDDVRFCPFCEESFEGEDRCPEHDLPLVDFAELGRLRAAQGPGDDEELAPYDLRFGRGLIVGAAALLTFGFFLPFVEMSVRQAGAIESVAVSAFEHAAGSRAMNLWLLPGVAFAWFFLAFRRRTLRGLRGVRLAAAATGVLGLSSLIYTLFGIARALREQALAAGRDVDFGMLAGTFVMALALVAGTVFSLRLGAFTPKPAQYRVD